jgi:hypothetical protein
VPLIFLHTDKSGLLNCIADVLRMIRTKAASIITPSKVTAQTLFLGFDAHGKSAGYCAGEPVPEFISDRSGVCDPHGCATTAEIELLGEPLLTRAVDTTYTKL